MSAIETITAYRFDGNIYESEEALRAHLINTRKMEAVAELSNIFGQIMAIDPDGMVPVERANILSRYADDIARWTDVLRDPLTEAEYLLLHNHEQGLSDRNENDPDPVIHHLRGLKSKNKS